MRPLTNVSAPNITPVAAVDYRISGGKVGLRGSQEDAAQRAVLPVVGAGHFTLSGLRSGKLMVVSCPYPADDFGVGAYIAFQLSVNGPDGLCGPGRCFGRRSRSGGGVRRCLWRYRRWRCRVEPPRCLRSMRWKRPFGKRSSFQASREVSISSRLLPGCNLSRFGGRPAALYTGRQQTVAPKSRIMRARRFYKFFHVLIISHLGQIDKRPPSQAARSAFSPSL